MMRMLLLIGLMTIVMLVYGQAKYARVKIYGDQHSIGKLDITLDHIQVNQGESIVGIFSDYELNVIRKSGLRYEILVEDVTDDYLKNIQRKSTERSVRADCNGTEVISPLDTITVPQDFSLGTMGGFLKYEEMLAHLDNMAAKYPNLITVRKPIFNPQASTDYQTHQGRPIYYIKISDNVTNNESSEETQILYTALHHAREPASLSQLIFYMYYLLENYGKNNWVTHLVNNREMILVPCLNPDGYIYNQTTHPNGGGMWRKNRRANAGGSFGVDLNRNYSYQWGFSGASSDPNSDVYKGLSSFSEPETKAIRSLCQQFNFKMAFNYHTHGDLLLFPYGYDHVQALDHTRFTTLTEEMVAQNNYVNEQSVLLYPAAGDSDDYMYGNTTEKPRIFAMTPEVGDDFWIPQSAIIPLCRETLWQNISMALQADAYPLLKSSTESLDAPTGTLSFTLEGRGLNTLQNAELSVAPKTPALTVGAASGIGNVNPFQVKTVTVPYAIAENTPNGTPIDFVCTVTFNNGKTLDYEFRLIWKGNDAVTGQVIFEDDFTTLNQWTTSGTWGLTTSVFASGPTAITDSPEGNYNNYVNMKIDTRDVIDLTGIQTAYLTFKARWNIEKDNDYLQLTVVKNNVEYPVCGNYSRVNSTSRIVYDGNQNGWVNEQINLADFLGSEIKLRFRLKSNGSITAEGFYLDDVAVTVVAQEDNEAPELETINPENNAVVSIDQEISLKFSENIIIRDENEIVLKRVSDMASVEAEIQVSGHGIFIRPVTLEYSTHYFLDISSTAIADISGNYFYAMDSDDWTFATTSPPDETPPQITTFFPMPGTTDVSESVILTAEFNEPILIQPELIKLMDDQVQEVPTQVSVQNQTLTILPQILLSGKEYTVLFLPGSVEDMSDNAFEGLTLEWNFTTKVITGIEKFNFSIYTVFPNPVRDKARISLPDVYTLDQVQLVDAVGRPIEISWRSIDKNTIEFEIGKARSGIYALRLRDATGSHTLKLLIE